MHLMFAAIQPTLTEVKVTVKGTSIINSNVELSKSTGNTEPMELNIEGGTFNGNLVVDSSITIFSIINVTGLLFTEPVGIVIKNKRIICYHVISHGRK